MSCSCGNNSCNGTCVKSVIAKYKPSAFIGGQTGVPGPEGNPGVGIVDIIDNGDGTFTIFLSDNSDYTINLPMSVPNDDWVVIENNGAGITNPQGTSGSTTYNDVNVNVAYKIMNADTAIVKIKAILDVDIDDVNDVLDFNFILDNISIGGSNWFPALEKRFKTNLPQSFAVPVAVTYTGGADVLLNSEYDSNGRAASTNGLFIFQSIRPRIASSGNYIFLIETEMTCQLESV